MSAALASSEELVPDGGVAGDGRGVEMEIRILVTYTTLYLTGDESFAGDGLIHIEFPGGGIKHFYNPRPRW